MAVVATIDKEHDVGDVLLVEGSFALSGSYAAGGESLASAFTGKVKSTLKARQIFVHGIAGYMYEYDQPNDNLFVRQSAAAASPQQEIPTAAFPAGVTGDTITFWALFNKFQ